MGSLQSALKFTAEAQGPASIAASLSGRAANRFGDCQLIKLVAVGGMGVVYKALRTSLDRTVALRMTKDHLARRRGSQQLGVSKGRKPFFVMVAWGYVELPLRIEMAPPPVGGYEEREDSQGFRGFLSHQGRLSEPVGCEESQVVPGGSLGGQVG